MCSNYMFLCDVETVFAKFSFAQAFHQVIQDLLMWSIHREPFDEELMDEELMVEELMVRGVDGTRS